MSKRKTIISALLTFLILLFGMGAYKMLSNKSKVSSVMAAPVEVAPEVTARQLKPGVAANLIPIDGRISAYEQVNVSANVSGILGKTPKVPKAGMYFAKGELLFDIDQRKAAYNLNALRSSFLNAITLMMPDLKLDYPESYLSWKNYLEEFEVEKSIQALPDISHREEKNFLAARNIYNLYYTIKSAEVQLSEYTIYAPISGVITQSSVFPGTMVMPGQILASMVSKTHYELTAPIAEEDLASVAIGNIVHLQGSNSDRIYKGKVIRIGQQLDPTTQRVPVYISVSDSGLKEDMYLKGQIEGTPLSDVFSIPKSLVVNQSAVYVLKDSIIHLQQLSIQGQSKDQVHVLGLAPDAWVVFANPASLFKGQKVVPVFNQD